MSQKRNWMMMAMGLAWLAAACEPEGAGEPEVELVRHESSYLYGAGGVVGNYWTNLSIPVCWENSGDSNAKSWVQSELTGPNSWSAVSNVTFTGWGRCTTASNGIRIRTNRGEMSAEYGQQNNGRALMDLDFGLWPQNKWSRCRDNNLNRENCIRTMAKHEFGHALGFFHEHDRADGVLSCSLDPDDFLPSGITGTLIGDYDPNSIMNYCSTSTELSQGDINGVVSIYGGPFPGFSACTNSNPCPPKVGDCDSDAHCTNDTVCKHDVGPLFGWTNTVDVCEVIDGLQFPGRSYCNAQFPCMSEIGDCDSDAECRGDRHCIDDIGDVYGWNSTADVCHLPDDVPLLPGRCTSANKCDSWVGPCTSDDQCKQGRCMQDVGRIFGHNSWVDVCVAENDVPFPGEDYCTPSNPCRTDLGDCDTDDDCFSGTVCDQNAGGEYGFAPTVDVCTDRFPRIHVRREGSDPTGQSHVTAACLVGTGDHPASVSMSTNGVVGTMTPFGQGDDVYCREGTSLSITCGLPGHTGTIDILVNGLAEKTCTGAACTDQFTIERNDVVSCLYDDGSLIPIDLVRTGDWQDSDSFDMSGSCNGGNTWVSVHELNGPAGKTIYCPAGDNITVTCTKVSSADDMKLSLNGTLLDSEGSGAVATSTQPVAAGDLYTCNFTDD